MVKMWSSKYLVIVSLYFCTCYGQDLLNSSELLNVDDYFGNSTNTYFNNTGDINRIINGRPLAIIRVPYIVTIIHDGDFLCGASIISSEWLVTAAHCIKPGIKFQIRAGSRYYKRGGIIRNVRYAVINSGYNKINQFTHDIALIRLKRPLKWSSKVRPIRLAKPNFKIPQKFLVSGWGVTERNRTSFVLRGAIVSYVPNCKPIYAKQNITLSGLHICAGAPGKDACFGDSGGPLANNGIQYGIVSGGHKCASPIYPGIYTNVKQQYRWIRNVIRRFGGPMPIGFK